MSKKRKGNRLERWEIALVKAMLQKGEYTDQDILAYFSRPSRSINPARVAEIKKGEMHRSVSPADAEELAEFLAAWPNLDPETGLSQIEDELLIKAREAMIAAVHTFNGAGLLFRAELFIVTSIIAWTYLLHACFRREKLDFRYKNADGTVKMTPQGAEKYWDLGKCLRDNRCPLPKGVVKNLEFLLDLRHEIEHRSTNRIDDIVSAKLQACCINFNDMIKQHFGVQYALERRLPIALQFVTFSADQRSVLKRASGLPANVESLIDAFEHELTEQEYRDPAYRYQVAFVPIVKNRASSADVAIQFVKADSQDARDINQVLLKEVDKKRYTAGEVVKAMKDYGFPKFNQHNHTQLWKALDGKNPERGFGRKGDYKKTWVWFDNWVERVRAHCEEQGDRYKAAP